MPEDDNRLPPTKATGPFRLPADRGTSQFLCGEFLKKTYMHGVFDRAGPRAPLAVTTNRRKQPNETEEQGYGGAGDGFLPRMTRMLERKRQSRFHIAVHLKIGYSVLDIGYSPLLFLAKSPPIIDNTIYVPGSRLAESLPHDRTPSEIRLGRDSCGLGR